MQDFLSPATDPLPTSLGEAAVAILRHPVRRLLRHWNWKTAVLSAAMRASIFFAVNLAASWDSAVSAALTELVYRPAVVGTLASCSQSFRRVQPAWKASVAMVIVLPALGHALEFAVHSLRGTPRLYESVAASVVFSMFTCVLSYFLHRRDILVVGDGARPLLVDIFQVPTELFDLLVREPLRALRGRNAPNRQS